MITVSKNTTKLALLAFVLSGFHAVSAEAQTPAVAPVAAAPAVVDSKGGAQVAADKQQAEVKKLTPAVKIAAAKPVSKAVVKAASVQVAPVKTVAAPVVVAPVAIAPVEEPKMSLKISGKFAPEVAIINDDAQKDIAKELQGYQFGWNNAYVQFQGTAKNASGVAFSAVMRIDASGMVSVSDIDVARTPQVINKQQPLLQVKRLYGMIEHESLGTIQFGNLYGPQYTQQEGGYDILYSGTEGFDRTNNPFKLFSAPTAAYRSSTDGSTSFFAAADPVRNTKIIYASPSLGGFKISGAFTPRLDETGSNFSYTTTNLIDKDKGRYQNSWAIVPSFKRTFGDVQIGLMGSYSQASWVDTAGKTVTGDDAPQDAKLWNAGAGIKVKGLEFGGHYTNSGVTGVSKTASETLKVTTGYGWNGAVAYNFEKAKVGFMYTATSVNLSENDAAAVNMITAYLDYKVAPGVKAYISENYLTGKPAKNQASATNVGKATIAELGTDTTSNVVYVGLEVSF